MKNQFLKIMTGQLALWTKKRKKEEKKKNSPQLIQYLYI